MSEETTRLVDEYGDAVRRDDPAGMERAALLSAVERLEQERDGLHQEAIGQREARDAAEARLAEAERLEVVRRVQLAAVETRLAEVEREKNFLKVNADAALVLVGAEEQRQQAESRADALAEALIKIASCDSHAPGDVVDIARAALAAHAAGRETPQPIGTVHFHSDDDVNLDRPCYRAECAPQPGGKGET